MQRFVLIDGNAIAHRAYHAMPNFTTSKGEPVGAIYGFTSMLIRVISDLKPEYVAVAFDTPVETFRKVLFKEYQGKRPEMEETLSSQFDGIDSILKALNIPIFELEGYEADDVIGTISRHVSRDIEVVIVSGDRDLLQLVTDNVKVYMPIKGLSEAKMYGIADVVEKYALQPIQIIDLKGLMGDASDNYPGVAGIGPKTATTLLQKYGTVEKVYENILSVPERVMTRLQEGKESAELSKKLATVVCDAPFDFDLKDCVFKVKDRENAAKVFHSFEFRTLTERLSLLLDGKPIDIKPKEKSTLKVTPKKKDSDQLSLI